MTSAEIQNLKDLLLPELKIALLAEAQGVGDDDVRPVSSLKDIKSLLAYLKVGLDVEIVEAPLSLLQVEIRSTETHFQWRLGEGDWENIIAIDDLQQPAKDYVETVAKPTMTQISQDVSLSLEKSKTATDAANTAAGNANEEAANLEELKVAVTNASYLAEQNAGEAEKQANYAKQEGDKAAGLNDDVRYLEGNKLEGLAVENDLLYGVIGGELVGEGIAMPSGGGGGGGGAVGSILRVKNLSGTAVTVAEGQAVVIRYSFSSLDSEDNTPTGDGTAEYFVNSIKVATETIVQGEISKDITKYLTKGVNAVKLTVTDSYGASRSLNIKAEVVDVNISSTFDASQPVTGEFTFRYTPIGAMEKVIHFLVDGVEIATNTTTLTLRELSQVIPAQTHGSHMLEVYVTASVNGVSIESAHLYYDLICLEEGNTTPIIASSFHTDSVQQFETLNIPFYVYSPSSSSSDVSLFVNGQPAGSRTVDRTLQMWAYRTSVAGKLTMEIKCGDVVKTFAVNVAELSIDVKAETQDLELYLTSQNRSNSEANKEEWKFGDITTSLTGFNWKTNGWVLDDNGYSCLRVGSGAKVEIPLNLFGQDFRAGGKTIEFEFLVRDVYNYDTPVVTCWSGNRGIKITAQDALMKSEQSEVSTVFKDGERVRIGFVVQKRALNRLINIYVNGVNSQSIQYPDADNFTQAVPVGITIGGADATVDVYNIRSYSNDLNRYQLLDNYIADMDDVSRKLTVYGRNKIYDSYGAVDINALNNYIPVMTIIGDLPQYKGDKKTVQVIYTDMERPDKSFTADGVQIDVQGTSSQYYPRKNYKLKFKNGFTMTTDGSHADGYTLSDTDCLPATVFCTKADFAESSGTHNTGIANYADWLLHQMGILTKPQEANPVIRTTVYGEPCCIAHRPATDSESEFIGKYNFNTDKGAENTFGFASGDESWEFRNNTSDRVLFKKSDYGDGWTDDFEARYPEDSIDFTKLKEITDWIVSCGTDVEKFKAELPQHMDKTQIVFYWLFTFIFGMVDQRAKNMFLTVYNGGLWLFILYDNDTCLGINNEGAISFKYNVEIHDVLGSKAVWNGADSALWNLVELAYPEEIKSMYYTMRQQNYLTYDKVIEFLNTRQSDKWSEAIFNEDGFFKYEKPLVDGYLDYSQSISNPQLVKTGAYLYALQGSREMHRKWWVANRLNYLDSKFLAGAVLSDTAVFRTYTPATWTGVQPCADITLTAFSAMYLNVKWGSATKTQRVGFNETFKMIAPEGMQFNDTETIIYGASLISSLGDLSPLYVGSVDVSKMIRLKELIVGSATEGYRNTNFTVMSVGNNKMLRKVDVRNCPSLIQPIDLSGCDNIEEIFAEGTGLTSVILPSAGILKKLHLPATVTNLTVKNQPLLTDENFILSGKDNLTTVVLENVTINVFSLLQECLATGNLQRIRCVGITGSAETADILYQIAKIGGLDENGYNTDQAVLTGTFHVGTIRQDKLEELGEIYPELAITYDELTYPPVVTFVFGSSQSKVMTGGKFTSNRRVTKVNEFTFKVTAEVGEEITYTYSCLNHVETSGTIICSGDETKEYTVEYIPLRTIRVLKRGTTIFIPSATVRIGDETFTANSAGQVQIRKKASIAGSVEAGDYNDSEFAFDAIVDDIVNTIYLDPQAIITFIIKDEKNALLSGATVSVGNKQAKTNENGICPLSLKRGDYVYSVKYDVYLASGELNVSLENKSIPVTVSLDVEALKPSETGNIQLMLTGTSGELNIASTVAEYVISWGDGETTIATEAGSQNYKHTYLDASYHQVEISNCNEIASCNGTDICLAAYWSIGNSKVSNLSFSSYDKLLYVGLVFKNDITRKSFRSCLSKCKSLVKVADGIFDNCTNATDFTYCFGYTYRGYGKLKSLPANIFKKCTKAINFSKCFRHVPIDLIPEDLFENCPLAKNFEACFLGTKIKSIPSGLFKNCIYAENFNGCFAETLITSIPADLFVNCINAKSFGMNHDDSNYMACGCFGKCKIELIPEGLFDNCILATDFSYCFSVDNVSTSTLRSVPESLFNKCTLANNFNSCFRYQKEITVIPSLWVLYYDKNVIKTSCFVGCTDASNWSEVPYSWGGEAPEWYPPFDGIINIKIIKDGNWWLNQSIVINNTTFTQLSDGSYSAVMYGIQANQSLNVLINGSPQGTIIIENNKLDYILLVGDNSSLYSTYLDYTTGNLNEESIISNDGWAYDSEVGGLRSKKIGSNGSIIFEVKASAGQLTITYGQNSEYSYDYCTLYTGGSTKLIDLKGTTYQGDNLTIDVEVTENLKFTYHKDSSGDTGKDAFWIKKIIGGFTLPSLPPDFVPTTPVVVSGAVLADMRAVNYRLARVETALGLND